MTDAELAEIAARAEAASPGPWEWSGKTDPPFESDGRTILSGDTFGPLIGCAYHGMEAGVMLRKEDAEFLRTAREDVSKLLAEVRRLQKELEKTEAERQKLHDELWTN